MLWVADLFLQQIVTGLHTLAAPRDKPNVDGMRLWSLHPRYLDQKGLVALWREALLAQAVLMGRTRGYRRHPQLDRFRTAPFPAAAITTYLRAVHAEAMARGYRFDAGRIAPGRTAARIAVNCGQLDFEWRHLVAKLEARAPAWLSALGPSEPLAPHPLFRMVPGGIAAWERSAKMCRNHRSSLYSLERFHRSHCTA